MRNTYLIRVTCVLATLLFLPGHSFSQSRDYQRQPEDSVRLLMMDLGLQMDIADAINDMYNFKMEEARQQFLWLRSYEPEHPLYPFLMGLSYWWEIVPNPLNKEYDKIFLNFMDLTIKRAKALRKKNPEHPEATFFLAAAYGFKGRLYSDRKQYGKATIAGKNAVDYLNEGRKYHDYGPEFLFGDGLYNYYSVYVSEHMPALRPIINMFPDGDKPKGLDQLREVSRFAFYTRTEAQFFLLSILSNEENKPKEARVIAEYLHQTYPNNPYFHRYLARILYRLGRQEDAKNVCLSYLHRLDSGYLGYEAYGGRYAGYFLGRIYENYRDYGNAKKYYQMVLDFGEEIGAHKTGYFLGALERMALISKREGDIATAKDYYRLVKKYAKWRSAFRDRARKFLKEHRRS